jgi:hypothetical protein
MSTRCKCVRTNPQTLCDYCNGQRPRAFSMTKAPRERSFPIDKGSHPICNVITLHQSESRDASPLSFGIPRTAQVV